MTITSNTTWTTNQTISGDLIIENNATLTISGTSAIVTVSGNVDVKPGSWLFVEDNSTLKTGDKIILESPNSLSGTAARLWVETGGTLTAANNEWEGVEVWGNILNFGPGLHSARAQATFLNATVEKAEIGVATYHQASGPILYKGGIVSAINTVFKNNRMDVCIRENLNNFIASTTNYISSVPTSNPSALINCQFLLTLTDNPFYPYNPATQPQPAGYSINMVALYDTKGIQILGCSFDDQTGEQQVISGVGVYNSGVEIGPYFLPGQPTTPSTFNNLFNGIYVSSPSDFIRVVAQQNNIENCVKGYCAVGTEANILLDNQISTQADGDNGIILGYGDTGFTVEGNIINSSWGIFLESPPDQNNEVYRNTISNYSYGIEQDGLFYTSTQPLEGLRLLCNDMESTDKPSPVGLYIADRIAPIQGIFNPSISFPFLWMSAGNLFTDLSKGNPQIYKTYLVPSFTYLYSNANPAEYPGSTTFPLVLASPNSCPVHQAPIIKPHIYSIRLADLENQIFSLTNKDSLSHDDSSLLSGLLYEHQKLIDSMVYTILDSKDSINYDSLAYAFEQVQYGGYYNKVKLAGVYLTQLKYDSAINLLNNIPENFSLNEEQQTDIHNMADMYTVIDSLAHNGDNWDSLSDYMIQEVHNVANDTGVYGKGVAIYLLSRYENYDFTPDPPELPQNYQTTFFQKLPEKKKIYPNPTDGRLFINWQSDKKLLIKIYSMEGDIVLTKKIQSGLSNIDIHALPAGVYSVYIYEGNKSVYQQNIVKK